MPPSSKAKKAGKTKAKSKSKSSSPKREAASSASATASASTAPPSSGFLLTCDAPTKQFIKHLDETKAADKRFIIEDLDATHLLIKGKARDEILRKVEEWMDENVFSNVERVGENLDLN